MNHSMKSIFSLLLIGTLVLSRRPACQDTAAGEQRLQECRGVLQLDTVVGEHIRGAGLEGAAPGDVRDGKLHG